MIDTSAAWDWASRVLALFTGVNAIIVGLGIAGIVIAMLFRLMKRQ